VLNKIVLLLSLWNTAGCLP